LVWELASATGDAKICGAQNENEMTPLRVLIDANAIVCEVGSFLDG
jgi:hypothetical protein